MWGEIQGDAGTWLARIYSVLGSQYRVIKLLPGEIALVHDVGQGLSSQRLRQTILLKNFSIAQSTSSYSEWVPDPLSSTGSTLFSRYNIIQSFTVFGATAQIAKVDLVTLAVAGYSGRLHPIWAWDTATDGVRAIRTDGAYDLLVPGYSVEFPLLNPTADAQTGTTEEMMNRLRVGYVTNAFGAGTADFFAQIMVLGFDRDQGDAEGMTIPNF